MEFLSVGALSKAGKAKQLASRDIVNKANKAIEAGEDSIKITVKGAEQKVKIKSDVVDDAYKEASRFTKGRARPSEFVKQLKAGDRNLFSLQAPGIMGFGTGLGVERTDLLSFGVGDGAVKWQSAVDKAAGAYDYFHYGKYSPLPMIRGKYGSGKFIDGTTTGNQARWASRLRFLLQSRLRPPMPSRVIVAGSGTSAMP